MRDQHIFDTIIIKHGLNNVILPDIKRTVNIGTRKHKKDYCLLYCGYDTETTTVRTPQGWRSAVYIHQISIAADRSACYVYLLRTWDEILSFFDILRQKYNLGEDRRLICFIANAGFEFQFMRKRMEWSEIFAKETREPLMAVSNGIDFREALAISGGSLAYLAKQFCYTQKLVGDLDYKQMRNTHTPLTDQEEAYCVNDVVILAEFSYIMHRDYIIPRHKIPMTKTGVLLSDVHKRFEKMSKDLDAYHLHQKAYERLIIESFPDEQTYNAWFKYLFRGGYVHANAVFADMDLPNVAMYDITSSYPSVILCDYCPVSPFVPEQYSEKALKSKCCWMAVKIYNIKITTHHTIESSNKIINCEGAQYDNGRLISAEWIEVLLTEIDLEIYRAFYQWSKMEVYKFYTAKRGKFPRFLRDNMVESYKKKQKLKMDGLSETQEYHQEKAYVNTHYGALCKRIRTSSITYDNLYGWGKKENDKPFDAEVQKAFLLPQAGIWVTAAARKALLLGVAKPLIDAGVNIVYFDTDSCKYIDHPKAKKIIDRYNKKRAKLLKKRGYRSVYIEGLGGFDYEGTVRLKTLGAKRYLTYDGKKIKATIAGMPKSSIKHVADTVDEIFAKFNSYGMSLTPEQSGKLTTAYTDEPYDIYVNGEWMHEESGVALYDIPFTMKVSDTYRAYLELLEEHERVGFMV